MTQPRAIPFTTGPAAGAKQLESGGQLSSDTRAPQHPPRCTASTPVPCRHQHSPELALTPLAIVMVWPVPSVTLVAVLPVCLSTVAARAAMEDAVGELETRENWQAGQQAATACAHSWERGSPSAGG